jgi:hypothetical protein
LVFVVVVVELSVAVPSSLVVAVVVVLADGSTAGVVAVVLVVVVVLVSGAVTGGVDTGGTVVLGVETGGTVCAMATPDVPAINAPARITNFMKIFSWSFERTPLGRVLSRKGSGAPGRGVLRFKQLAVGRAE